MVVVCGFGMCGYGVWCSGWYGIWWCSILVLIVWLGVLVLLKLLVKLLCFLCCRCIMKNWWFLVLWLMKFGCCFREK